MSKKSIESTSDAPTEPQEPAQTAPVQEPGQTPEALTEPPEDAQEVPEPEEEESGNREAAKYRTRLRETEAERDGLVGQLEASRRQIAESIADGPGRIRPGGLWAAGVEVADLLADDGTVDRGKVMEACDTAATTLGLARRPKPDANQGKDTASPSPRDDMAAAIRG